MNGQLFLSSSSFLLRRLMVQCVFLLFFSQGFSVHWLDMLFKIDLVLDGM